MKRELNEIWKVKEGNKTIWKLQAERGILSFTRYKDALRWKLATIYQSKEVR